MQSMELQNTVKEALNALYHHPDDAVRMQADRWLQDFQRTIDAWQVADNLLHDATSNLETLIFCSQTLRSKVQRDFEELPSEAFRQLRDSLNNLLKKFHKGPPIVRTQIGIAVAALAVHVPAEDRGNVGIVNWLQDEMNSHPEYIPGFLELLTVLPEEAFNYKIAARPEQRRHFEKELTSQMEIVLSILTACLNISELKEQVLEAVASWLRLKHGIPGSLLATHPLVLTALSSLNSDILSEASINVVSELIHYTASGSSGGVSVQMPLIQVIVPQVMSLLVQLRDSTKDDEDIKAIARLFADMGDSYVELIATGSSEAMMIVNALLEVASLPEYNIASMTFNFWHSLQVILTKRNSYISFGDEASIEAERNRRLQVFRQSYESLVSLVGFRVQYPQDYKDLSYEDLKEFKQTRYAIADVLTDAASVLGGDAMLQILYVKLVDSLSFCGNEQSEWHPAEAALFCIGAISNYVSVVETNIMPQVMDLLSKLPHQPQLLQTDCRKKLCAYCNQLFHIYYTAVNGEGSFKGSAEDSLHLVEALSMVITELPPEPAKGALEELCSSVVTPLQEIFNQGPEVLEKKHARELTAHIDQFAYIFRYVNHPGAVADAIHRLWPIFKAIFDLRAWDMRTMESLCRACKYAVRTSGRFMGITIGAMLEEIQGLYQQHHQPCFLYLSSEVIKIFGSDPSCASYLKNLIEALFKHTTCLLTSIKEFTARPDIADDCFLLASRCIRYCPQLLIPSAVFPALIDCSMIGITVQHREASNSVLTFLSDIFDLEKSSKGEQLLSIRDSVIIPRGATITRVLMAALTGALPNSRLEMVAYSLLALIRAYGMQALEWASESVSLIPLTAVKEVERTRFLQALSDAASGADANALIAPVEELSDVCRRNRTVQESVQGALKPLELDVVPVS
ncbi:transportin MOS14-like isoform X5 [Durio zibethinus]|uniref:Transportin MOS14-like isoform X5 n=1 Tax=Durio zibethinus TaxID=66656 RepID=A0A6P6ASU8_DURZI|nr:transportin MOS14-like isoform X5 [Durio zibethinus]